MFLIDIADAEPGGDAIDDGLRPKGEVLGADIAQMCPHAVELDVGRRAMRGGKNLGEIVPEGRECRGGPADAGEEQQRHGCEDDDEEH